MLERAGRRDGGEKYRGGGLGAISKLRTPGAWASSPAVEQDFAKYGRRDARGPRTLRFPLSASTTTNFCSNSLSASFGLITRRPGRRHLNRSFRLLITICAWSAASVRHRRHSEGRRDVRARRNGDAAGRAGGGPDETRTVPTEIFFWVPNRASLVPASSVGVESAVAAELWTFTLGPMAACEMRSGCFGEELASGARFVDPPEVTQVAVVFITAEVIEWVVMVAKVTSVSSASSSFSWHHTRRCPTSNMFKCRERWSDD